MDVLSVSNTPGNPGNLQSLLEIYRVSWKFTESPGNLQSLLEIFWFTSRVRASVVNISYNSCISKSINTQCQQIVES